MDQIQIRSILEELRVLDQTDGKTSFWMEADDTLMNQHYLEIETVFSFKRAGFKISLDAYYFVEIKEYYGTYFLQRQCLRFHNSAQIRDQARAKELFYRVMVDLLDRAA